MHPIHLRAGRSEVGLSASELHAEVIGTCNKHRAEKRALVFAFLLFDRRHAQVARVLEDPRFYETLDQIAGSLLTVFFIHSEPSQRGKTRDAWNLEADEVAKIITGEFEVAGAWDRTKPAILFFQVENERVSQARFASFRDDRLDDTFMAIRRLLKTAADSVAAVQPEYAGNSTEIFNLIDNAVRNDSFLNGVLMVYKAVTFVGKFFQLGRIG
jgi:hypothetical protein